MKIRNSDKWATDFTVRALLMASIHKREDSDMGTGDDSGKEMNQFSRFEQQGVLDESKDQSILKKLNVEGNWGGQRQGEED